MTKFIIEVSIYSRNSPNQDRLRIADRYEERAHQAISRQEREALYTEADRIYREEYRK